jgi:hypothetical protein
MSEAEVVCVDRELYPGGGSRIFRLGIRSGESVTLLSEEEMVRHVRAGYRFYVEGGGRRAYLTLGTSERGSVFVETEADQTVLDNLAALPACEGDRPAPHRPTSEEDPDEVDQEEAFDVDAEGHDVDQGND